MAVLTKHFEKRHLGEPDEVRETPKGRIELYRLGERIVARTILEPGWRWSEHVRPSVGTDSCTAEHLGYLVRGRMGIRTSEGQEFEFRSGDIAWIPPGHEAWVIGDEKVEFVDFTGGQTFQTWH